MLTITSLLVSDFKNPNNENPGVIKKKGGTAKPTPSNKGQAKITEFFC